MSGSLLPAPCSLLSRLLPRAEGVLFDHPLLLRRQIDPLILDVLVFCRHTQDLESFCGRAFEPIPEAPRNQYSFTFAVFADELIAFAIELGRSAYDVPERVIPGMGVEVIFAALFYYLHHHLHQI